MYSLKRLFRRVYYNFSSEIYIEWMILDFLIFSVFFFGNSGYKIVFFLSIPYIIFKLYRDGLRKSIFTLNLFEQAGENAKFQIYGILNVFFLILIMQFSAERFHTFASICVFRMFFAYENISIQYYILLNMTRDLYVEGNVKEISKLSNNDTIECLKFLKLIKQDVKESADRRVESEKLKTELITNISHDLKTPLTSIINYINILSMKETMDDEARAYIEILGRNSTRLMSLIVDLIYASKTGSGDVKVEKSFIDFNELVSQIYSDFYISFEKRGLEFVYESDEENISLYTDGNLLSRIIQNLVSNSYKYSRRGSKIYASTKYFDDYIVFSIVNVTEDEIDINNYNIDELMEEMFKFEKSRTTEGSGLGLYITKNLVEILGGEFDIELEPYEFRVNLKLYID